MCSTLMTVRSPYWQRLGTEVLQAAVSPQHQRLGSLGPMRMQEQPSNGPHDNQLPGKGIVRVGV